jgi:hypothetical protein
MSAQPAQVVGPVTGSTPAGDHRDDAIEVLRARLTEAKEYAAWMRRQEDIHGYCEGHAVCDFVAWADTIQVGP